MLADPRAGARNYNFASQWQYLRNLTSQGRIRRVPGLATTAAGLPLETRCCSRAWSSVSKCVESCEQPIHVRHERPEALRIPNIYGNLQAGDGARRLPRDCSDGASTITRTRIGVSVNRGSTADHILVTPPRHSSGCPAARRKPGMRGMREVWQHRATRPARCQSDDPSASRSRTLTGLSMAYC